MAGIAGGRPGRLDLHQSEVASRRGLNCYGSVTFDPGNDGQAGKQARALYARALGPREIARRREADPHTEEADPHTENDFRVAERRN